MTEARKAKYYGFPVFLPSLPITLRWLKPELSCVQDLNMHVLRFLPSPHFFSNGGEGREWTERVLPLTV